MHISLYKGANKLNKFGSMIKDQRLGSPIKITAQKLAKDLKITPAYLCDIEKGNRYPSKQLLDKLVIRLDITGTDKDSIYDLAAMESTKQSGVSADISDYIMKNKNLRKLIRIAKENKIGEQYWKELLTSLVNERSVKNV